VGRPDLDSGTLGLKVLVKSLRRVALRLMVSKTRSDTAWNGVRCVATQLLGPLVSIDWDGSLFKLVGRPGLPPETLGILTGRVPIATGDPWREVFFTFLRLWPIRPLYCQNVKR